MGRFLSSVRALRSFGVRKSPSRSKPIENLRAANIRFPIVRKKKKDGAKRGREERGGGSFLIFLLKNLAKYDRIIQ